MTKYFIAFHALSAVTICSVTALRTVIIQILGLNAARKLHAKMLWRLLLAPVSFFDQVLSMPSYRCAFEVCLRGLSWLRWVFIARRRSAGSSTVSVKRPANQTRCVTS